MKTSSADSLFDTESIWAILLRIAPPVMLAQLIQAAGYELNFSDVDGDLLMLATIQAAQGVTNLLKQVFSDTIHKR